MDDGKLKVWMRSFQEELDALYKTLLRMVKENEQSTPPPTGEHGEPWEIFHKDDSWRARDVAGLTFFRTYDKKRLNRAVACVNALAGIRNPAAVGDVVEWLREMVAIFDRGNAVNVTCAEVRHFLAALDKAPDGEGGG